jgi:serine protease Do
MANKRRRRIERRRAVVCVLSALLLTLIAPMARPVSALAAPLDPAALIAQVEPGLVQITTLVDFQGVVGNGTGIVLSPDGQILTNHHVVQGANSIRVLSMANGQTFDADVIGYDRDDDIAVLQLRGAGGLPVAPIGDSNSLALGEPVLTIGNANGTGNPLTHETGTVTNLSRSIAAEDELTGSKNNMGGLIESSTNLRAGDSGGALVNSAGQVVGLNAAATINFKVNGESTPGGEGFAIPMNRAMDIANQIRGGAASPAVHIGPSAMLGVGISASGQSGSGGLPVRSVLRGGPADVVGLRPGDIITNIDGVPIDSANALTGLLDQRYPGNVINLAWIDRAGVPQNATATLAAGPVS